MTRRLLDRTAPAVVALLGLLALGATARDNPYPSRGGPPLSAVLSGKALNDRLAVVMQVRGRGEAGPEVRLDAEVLRRINLTGPGGGAGASVLHRADRLTWPAVLRQPPFVEDQRRAAGLLAAAAREARAGRVSVEAARDLDATLTGLGGRLNDRVDELTVSEFLAARRFLNVLGDAPKALRDPGLAKTLQALEGLPRVGSVAGLADLTARYGLGVAPAFEGDEAAYQALDRALGEYVAGLGPDRPR